MFKRALIILPLIAFVSCSQQKAQDHSAPSFSEFKNSEVEKLAVLADTAPESGCGEDCADRRQEMRYLYYVAKQIYPYWEEKKKDTGTDYEALSKILEQSITDKTSLSEYYLLVRRWAASFHDGHVSSSANEKISKLEIYSAMVRLDILAPATENEKVFVVASEMKNAPVPVGDEVLQANGIPIKEVLDKNEEFCFGSTKAMRRRCAVRRIVDVIGIKNAAPLVITLKNAGAVTIPRKINLSANPAAALPPEDTSGVTLISATILPNGIGYLKIDGFGGSQIRELINQAMDRLQDTNALIIDMRENGGGDQSGNEILARLTEKEIVRYKTSFRSSDFLLSQRPDLFFFGFDPSKEFTEWRDLSVKAADPSKRYLGKPVVVLTSSWCFSACDTFVAGLKAHKLATIIGEPTGGGTGSPLNIILPASEFAFRYSVMRGITANNEPIEGAGTLPDIYQEATKSDLLAGTDSQLLAALDFIKTKSGLPAGESSAEVPGLMKTQLNWDIPATVEDELKMKRLMKWDEQF